MAAPSEKTSSRSRRRKSTSSRSVPGGDEPRRGVRAPSPRRQARQPQRIVVGATLRRRRFGLRRPGPHQCSTLAAAAAAIDASLAPLLRTAEVAETNLAELARSLSRYGDGIDVNPARLGAYRRPACPTLEAPPQARPTAEDVLTYRRGIGVTGWRRWIRLATASRP